MTKNVFSFTIISSLNKQRGRKNMDLYEAFQILQQVVAQTKVEEVAAIEAGRLAGSAIAEVWLQICPKPDSWVFTPDKRNGECYLVHEVMPKYCTGGLNWKTVQFFAENVEPLITRLTHLCAEHIKKLRAAKQVFDQIIKAMPTEPSV